MMASMPEVKFDKTPRGIAVRSIRRQDDGKVFYRVTEAALPTLRVVPNPRVAQFARVESIGWTLPIDDASFRIYVAGRVKNSGDIGRMKNGFSRGSRQQANASRPDGLSALRRLANDSTGSAKNITPKREASRSKLAGSNG